MKKYINSSLILLVALLSLTVFYVSQATSSSNLPDFHLKQTHGDSKLLNTLALEAAYIDTDFAENFTTTKDGSYYLSETSFFKQVDYWQKTDKTAEMKNLRNQFPSFMRGKTNNTQFYIDTKQVIYVDTVYDYSNNHGYHNFGLKINHLNKKTKDTQSFEVKIPNQENSGYIDVLDVQIMKDELRVVVLSDDEAQRINEYTINLSKERVIDDTSIFTATNQSDTQFYYSRLMENEPTQTNPNFLFQIDQHTPFNGGEGSQTTNIDFYSYNYNTGKSDKLKLPEDTIKQLLYAGSYTIAYDSKSLYISIFNHDENRTTSIKMIKYDLPNQKISKNHTIKIDSDMIEDSHSIHLYQNNLFLIYHGEESKPEIKIFDFDSGESILEATLEVKDQKQKVNYKDISIHEVIGL